MTTLTQSQSKMFRFSAPTLGQRPLMIVMVMLIALILNVVGTFPNIPMATVTDLTKIAALGRCQVLSIATKGSTTITIVARPLIGTDATGTSHKGAGVFPNTTVLGVMTAVQATIAARLTAATTMMIVTRGRVDEASAAGTTEFTMEPRSEASSAAESSMVVSVESVVSMESVELQAALEALASAETCLTATVSRSTPTSVTFKSTWQT